LGNLAFVSAAEPGAISRTLTRRWATAQRTLITRIDSGQMS
jgi:hypothetical protein